MLTLVSFTLFIFAFTRFWYWLYERF